MLVPAILRKDEIQAKFVFTDAIKDRYGKYHNDITYEIIFE